MISHYFKIEPNIITLAKGLASGIPIGVMMTNLKDVLKAGDHGSTFGGNHFSTTVCKEVLNVLEEYKNSGKLKKNIRYFDNCLNYFVDTYKEVFSKKTGFGFMQGLVLKDEKKLEEIIKIALKNRILVLKSGKNIIRFLPPLNISKKEMKQGFKRFENALIEIKK